MITSLASAAVLALGAGACGGEDESTSTTTATTTQTQASTTTQTQSPAPDATDFLGATLTAATGGEPGVVVVSVAPDGLSRLKPGDVIIALNGKPVSTPEELVERVGDPEVGEEFLIRVVRGTHRFTLAEVQSPAAYLGAEVEDATGDAKGALVRSVGPDTPAAAAELQRGDVITAIDDVPVENVDELLKAIATHAPGDTVTVTVSRGSRRLELDATLAPRPAG